MTKKSFIPIDFSCFVPPPAVLENYRMIVQAHAQISTIRAKSATEPPIKSTTQEAVFG